MPLALVLGVLFAFAALATSRALGPERGRVALLVLLGAAVGTYLGAALSASNLDVRLGPRGATGSRTAAGAEATRA